MAMKQKCSGSSEHVLTHARPTPFSIVAVQDKRLPNARRSHASQATRLPKSASFSFDHFMSSKTHPPLSHHSSSRATTWGATVLDQPKGALAHLPRPNNTQSPNTTFDNVTCDTPLPREGGARSAYKYTPPPPPFQEALWTHSTTTQTTAFKASTITF